MQRRCNSMLIKPLSRQPRETIRPVHGRDVSARGLALWRIDRIVASATGGRRAPPACANPVHGMARRAAKLRRSLCGMDILNMGGYGRHNALDVSCMDVQYSTPPSQGLRQLAVVHPCGGDAANSMPSQLGTCTVFVNASRILNVRSLRPPYEPTARKPSLPGNGFSREPGAVAARPR
jgi:hypothetical protein